MSKNSDKAAVFDSFADQLLKPFTDEQVTAVRAKVEQLEAEITERLNKIEALAFVLKMDDVRKNGKKPRKSPEPRKAKGEKASRYVPEPDAPVSGQELAREAQILGHLRIHGPRKPATMAGDLGIPLEAVNATIERLKAARRLQAFGPGVGLPKE